MKKGIVFILVIIFLMQMGCVPSTKSAQPIQAEPAMQEKSEKEIDTKIPDSLKKKEDKPVEDDEGSQLLEKDDYSEENEENEDSEKAPSNVEIYEDENIKVEFSRIFEEAYINCLYMQFLIKNKSDKTLLVSFNDASVNGYSTLIVGGQEIPGGKNSMIPYWTTFEYLDVDNVEDVKEIEFKIYAMDYDSFDTILDSDPIVVKFDT